MLCTQSAPNAGERLGKRPAALVTRKPAHGQVDQNEFVMKVTVIDDPAMTLMDTTRGAAAPGAFGSPARTAGVEGTGGIGGGYAVDMKAW